MRWKKQKVAERRLKLLLYLEDTPIVKLKSNDLAKEFKLDYATVNREVLDYLERKKECLYIKMRDRESGSKSGSEAGSESGGAESEVDSIDLLMESYVNLQELVRELVKDMKKKNREMLERITAKLEQKERNF